jgi:uncharacterized damage-inducible protein DinB
MTPEQGKLLSKVFVDTIQQETETTKKVIRAVPEDKKSYKPDPKSMSANDLAWHIATSECWFLGGVVAGKFDMSGQAPAPPSSIRGIVEWYETNHRDLLNKLKDLPGEHLVKTVPLFPGMELPAVAYLNFLNLHSSHHRGQLSAYLRPMGAKVPAIYGGSADEPMQH